MGEAEPTLTEAAKGCWSGLLELGANVKAKDYGTNMPVIYEAVARGH